MFVLGGSLFLLVVEPCILMGAHLRIDGVEISTEKQIYNACGCHSVTFLSGLVYLVGVWLGEDQRTNTIETHRSRNQTCTLKDHN